jgi:hypothetical protein
MVAKNVPGAVADPPVSPDPEALTAIPTLLPEVEIENWV